MKSNNLAKMIGKRVVQSCITILTAAIQCPGGLRFIKTAVRIV